MIEKIKKEISSFKNPVKAKISQGFFKTGKGQYGEGDIFLGISVPQCRAIAKKYYIKINYNDLNKVIKSKFHEERLIALLILVTQYEKSKKLEEKKQVLDFYLSNLEYINNWDLVDLSCYKILGRYLFEESRDFKLLINFAKSSDLWTRRISIVSTVYFIRLQKFDITLQIAKILLNDNEDLIHKAVGWMLREVGKKDLKVLEGFLAEFYKKMPRTMLRYAIEKFDKAERNRYLKGLI